MIRKILHETAAHLMLWGVLLGAYMAVHLIG